MFNKAISTPIAIIIILVLVILVGGFTWFKYGEMWREISELPEIELPEKEEAETKVSAEDIKTKYPYWNEECESESFPIPKLPREKFVIRPKNEKGFLCGFPEKDHPVTALERYPGALQDNFQILEEVSKAAVLSKDLESRIISDLILFKSGWEGYDKMIYVDLIYNENLNSQGLKIIGYAGSDVDPQNYYYKAVFLKDDEVIFTWHIPFFGYIGDENLKWARDEVDTLLKKNGSSWMNNFNDRIITAVRTKDESSPIYQAVKEHDSRAKSIKLED